MWATRKPLVKLRSISTVLFALSTLTACGGAGGGTPESAPIAVTPPVTSVPVPPAPATIAVPSDHVLVWGDEFASDGLPDAAKWTHETGRNKQGWYNNEKQYYSAPRLENALVHDGMLTITALKEARSDQPDWGGQSYSSARLATVGKKEWTYGFFEIRAKLPCGKGTWPAIWMLGSQGTWPAQGELDIMEWVGNRPERMFSTVHTTSGSGGKSSLL